MFSPILYVVPLVLIVAVYLIAVSVRILREYERAVVFTLGRFQKVKGPGLVLLIPLIQEMVRVDLRIQVIEIPTQDVISRDNVSMKVDAVLYFNVVDRRTRHHQGAEIPSRHQHAGADDLALGAGAARTR